MSKLIGMGFTLQMDREIDPEKHYISPGGYILNGKHFDFFTSRGSRVDGDNTKVEFWVEDFDEDFYKESYVDEHGGDENPEPITEEDCEAGEFSEFFIYTGEGDDEICGVLSVLDISFAFDDGKEIYLKNDSPTVRSANRCIEEQFAEFDREI